MDHSINQEICGHPRLPEPDFNAPQLPPTAYVSFSDYYKLNLVEDHRNFSEIAKATSAAWQAMPGEEKSEREAKTALLKEAYRLQLQWYKQTENRSMDRQYVERFKLEANSQSSSNDRPALLPRREYDKGITRNPELKQILLKLTTLASLNDDESSTIQRIVETSPGRRYVTAQSQQRLLSHEPAHDANSASTALGHISEEAGFDETPALGSLPEQMADDSSSLQSPHVYMINPFLLQPEDVTTSFLSVFLERVNPILYLFDERALFHNLALAYGGEVKLATQVRSELCLALAIGAQCCDHGTSGAALLWYENGRRFLDDYNWDHKPWVMRVVTLISIYHLSTRHETARHYLQIGIRIARANNFFNSPSNSTDQMRDREWLPVWNTIVVIDGWLSMTPVSPSLAGFGIQMSVDSMTHSASVIHKVPFRYFCDFFTTMRSITRSITAELSSNQIVSYTTTQRWLQELETWREGVPEECFCFHLDSNQIHPERTGSPERTTSVTLHLVSMYAAIKLRLSFPSLIEVFDWFKIQPRPPLQPDQGTIRVAGLCIKTATDYAHFCVSIFHQGFFCADSSFPTQLLLDAALTGMTARVLYTRALRAGMFDLLATLEISELEWTAIVEMVRIVLGYRPVENQKALSELDRIVSLEQIYL